MSDFNPQTSVLPIKDKYLPMYRLRPTDGWNYVRKVECGTASEAKRIADQIVQSIVAPAKLIEVEPLGSVQDWRREKAAAAEAERRLVFGEDSSRTVHRPGKRPLEIVIERRRKIG